MHSTGLKGQTCQLQYVCPYTGGLVLRYVERVHMLVKQSSDTDQYGNFYTTTKGGRMTQERLLNFTNQVITLL